MSAHTPGPWAIDGDTRPAEICTIHGLPKDKHEQGFAYIRGAIGYWDATEDENLANARLIAAAPDMFEVLTSIEAVILDGDQEQFKLILCVDSPIRNAIYAAIRKATRAES